MSTDASCPSNKQIKISYRDILFGAVALNLIILPLTLCGTVFAAVTYLVIKAHAGGQAGIVTLPKEGTVTGFVVLALVLASLGWNAIIFCWWAARGFVEILKFRIVCATIGFLAYSGIMIRFAKIDGYVCLAVTIFIAIAVAVEQMKRPQSNLKGRASG